MSFVLISAILPVVVLLVYIYRKDKDSPEPVGKLLQVFFVGCLSVLPAVMMEYLLSAFTPGDSVTAAVYMGYVVAGLSEELCKLVLLIWVVWRSPYFDEYFDGIVYAVFLGMGFACVENVMYVFQSADTVTVSLMRGLLAVPAHFLFAVTMGYHLSLAKFDPSRRPLHILRALLYPVLLHGTYDALLMVSDALGAKETEGMELTVWLVLMVLFVVFDIMMWRRGLKRIRRMQQRSKEQNFDRYNPFAGFQWDV